MDPSPRALPPRSHWVPAGAVTLHAHTYAEPADGAPTVLALCAADQTCHRWPDSLLTTLADAGVGVVSFDHRETGRSTRLPGDVGYRLDDLVADSVAVMDALGLADVHLLGRSMGGMVAQLLALDHPARVASMTLLSTTPGPETEGLSGPDDALVAALAERLFAGPPTDETGRLEWIVDGQRPFAGDAHPFDEEAQRQMAAAEIADDHPTESGHGTAVFSTQPWIDRLDAVDAPATVIHGDADPVYGLDHAAELARRLRAELVVLEGVGHELPEAIGGEVAAAVLATVRRAAPDTG